MVRVRLSRYGTKKVPYYHIIVTDRESSRDGGFIEQIGTYDAKKPMAEARVDRARLEHWVSKGALPTGTVAKVLREQKKAMQAFEQQALKQQSSRAS